MYFDTHVVPLPLTCLLWRILNVKHLCSLEITPVVIIYSLCIYLLTWFTTILFRIFSSVVVRETALLLFFLLMPLSGLGDKLMLASWVLFSSVTWAYVGLLLLLPWSLEKLQVKSLTWRWLWERFKLDTGLCIYSTSLRVSFGEFYFSRCMFILSKFIVIMFSFECLWTWY